MLVIWDWPCVTDSSTYTWPSHITSLIILSDLVPASVLLGLKRSKPNTGIKTFPSSHLNITKVSVHDYAHISIIMHQSGTCGRLPGTSAHPDQHPISAITVSHGWSTHATASRSSSPTMSRLFHSFLTLSLRFFWYITLVHVYTVLINSCFRFYSYI